MANEDAQRITDPSQIAESDLSIGLSNLSIETSERGSPPQSQTRQARLHLLQPLATPAMLAACRNPASRVVRFDDGDASDTVSHEWLDITALSKAWRQALVQAPPVSRLTFDLSLPKSDKRDNGEGEGKDAYQKLCWNAAMPAHGQNLIVVERDITSVVITIATMMRMRVQGDVHFEAVCDGGPLGLLSKPRNLLRAHLLAFTKARGTRTALETDGENNANSEPTGAVGKSERVGAMRARRAEKI